MTNAYRPTADRVHEQVALYEATEGRLGGTLEGRPVVILSTIGANTGNVRKNPVMRIKDGDTYVVVPQPDRTPRGVVAGRRDGVPVACPRSARRGVGAPVAGPVMVLEPL